MQTHKEMNQKTADKLLDLLTGVYDRHANDRKEVLKLENKIDATLQSMPSNTKDAGYNFVREMRAIIKAQGVEVATDPTTVQGIKERTDQETPDVEPLTDAEQTEYSDVNWRSGHLKARDKEHIQIARAIVNQRLDPTDDGLESLQARYKAHYIATGGRLKNFTMGSDGWRKKMGELVLFSTLCGTVELLLHGETNVPWVGTVFNRYTARDNKKTTSKGKRNQAYQPKKYAELFSALQQAAEEGAEELSKC